MEANGGGRKTSDGGSGRTKGQWPEAVRFAPLSVYVELRDELWSDFARQSFGPEKERHALRALALLHLANKTVAALLGNTQLEIVRSAAELERCKACDSFLEQMARSTQKESPQELMLEFIARSFAGVLKDDDATEFSRSSSSERGSGFIN